MNHQTYAIFDRNILPELLGDADNEVLISLYDTYIQHTIDNWLTMTALATNQEWKEVTSKAHLIKSSSRTIGAIAFAQAMTDLEKAAINGTLSTRSVTQFNQLLEETLRNIREVKDSLIAS